MRSGDLAMSAPEHALLQVISRFLAEPSALRLADLVGKIQAVLRFSKSSECGFLAIS
jgi:hypothetical protein